VAERDYFGSALNLLVCDVGKQPALMFANGLCRVNDCGSNRKFNLAANGRRFCAAREDGFGRCAIAGEVRYCAAIGGRAEIRRTP
jgi:hypothetical protein